MILILLENTIAFSLATVLICQKIRVISLNIIAVLFKISMAFLFESRSVITLLWDCGYSVLWKVQGCLVDPLGFHCFPTGSFFNDRKPIALLPAHCQVLPWVENCYVSFQYFIHMFETFDAYFKNHNYQAWYYIILCYFNRRLTPGSSHTWNHFQNMRYFPKPGNSGKANIGLSWRVFCSIG